MNWDSPKFRRQMEPIYEGDEVEYYEPTMIMDESSRRSSVVEKINQKHLLVTLSSKVTLNKNNWIRRTSYYCTTTNERKKQDGVKSQVLDEEYKP